MKKLVLLLLVFISLQPSGSAQKFEIHDGQFMLNDTAVRIYGGEMHYARIPRQYWQHRIEMARAMGCNAISIYVFWNYHETAPGVWDWTNDNHDLRAFVETAKAEGMYIILRPGPYTCAEWEFGGFPYWMMNTKLRSDDPAFLDSCRMYLRQVYLQVDGLFIEQGGNIIMTQVENEFGFFAFETNISKHKADSYKNKLLNIYREVGFTHTLFTCDGGIIPIVNFARMGHVHGIFPGTNDSKFLGTARHTVHRYFSKKGPYYIPEEYAGWFTHWGDAHVFHRDVEKYKTHIEALLKTDFSFCYYMIHGGTNFGFMNGANSGPAHEVWPVVTSYDYGAPIDEGGHRIPLYDSLRAVYQRVTHRSLPDVPGPIASMKIDKIELQALPFFKQTIWANKVDFKEPLPMEQMPQTGYCIGAITGYGYIEYEKKFAEERHADLSTDGITDFATIYVNDSLVATINRMGAAAATPKTIKLHIPKDGVLKLLVENMGRVNFGKKMLDNKKGVTKGIKLDGKYVEDWHINLIPMKDMNLKIYKDSYMPHQPMYYYGEFNLKRTADTYLDMHGFGKGVVFVNGHNLGRYWEIGPQYSLYVPGVWLKQGSNEIVIFDQLNHSQMHSISATAKPVNN